MSNEIVTKLESEKQFIEAVNARTANEDTLKSVREANKVLDTLIKAYMTDNDLKNYETSKATVKITSGGWDLKLQPGVSAADCAARLKKDTTMGAFIIDAPDMEAIKAAYKGSQENRDWVEQFGLKFARGATRMRYTSL